MDDAYHDLMMSSRQLWQQFCPIGTMFCAQSIWHQVGIHTNGPSGNYHTDLRLVKIPKPSPVEDEEKPSDVPEVSLPQTLVRIPIESQSEELPSHNGTGKSSDG